MKPRTSQNGVRNLPRPCTVTPTIVGRRQRGERDPAPDDVRPDQHPDGPGGEDDAEPDVLDAQDVLDVDEVGGDRRGHEEERDEDDHDHQGDDGVGEEEPDPVPCAARLALGLGAADAAHGERECGETDDDEGRGVDEHRGGDPTRGDEEPAAERAEREAERAGRLHRPVRLLERAPAGDDGDEGELGRLRDGDPHAEQRRQDVQQHLRVQKREPDCDDGLARGDDEEERAGLHPVDEQPDVAGKEHDGRPEADEDRGDRDAAAHPVAGELLRLERERDERDPVADAPTRRSRRRPRGGRGL